MILDKIQCAFDARPSHQSPEFTDGSTSDGGSDAV